MSSTTLQKLNIRFLDFAIFVLFFRKNNEGFFRKNHESGPVHLKIHLVPPSKKTENYIVHRNSILASSFYGRFEILCTFGPSYANDFDRQLFVSLKALGTAYYNSAY